ncbi:unnamed protein product [Closterium sp. Yama58-4]|nr:unnamed protein product [Closterium sp. Yama58-4]
MEEVAVIADAAGPSKFSLLLPSHQGFMMIFQNRPLIVAFISLWVAQFLKPFTLWHWEKRWDFKRILGSGGMPSSHSSSVMGLACAVAFQEGTASPLFAACLVFAVVVMYDASGVRLQAGRQAEVLNQIVYELPPDHPLAESRPLKEPIGHTQPQVVAGALVGVFVAYFMHHFYPTATASLFIALHPSPPCRPCRRAAVAWRVEELQPPSERVLFHFARADARGERGARGEHGAQGEEGARGEQGAEGAMDAWRVYSDAIYGGSSTATLAHATSGSAEPAGSGTELSGMGGDQGRGDMMGRDRMDGSAGIVHPPHPPSQLGWEARAMRRQQHHHFEPPSSFAVFAGSLSRRVQGEGVEGGGPEARGGRLLKGGFAGIRTVELFSPFLSSLLPPCFSLISQLRTEGWVGGPAGSEENTWQGEGVATLHLSLPAPLRPSPPLSAPLLPAPPFSCPTSPLSPYQLRTEGWVGGPAGSEENTWQAFLPSPRGWWGVVQIPLASYRFTWKGRVVGGGWGGREGEGGSGGGGMEMNARRVVGMGLSVNVSTPPMHSPHLSVTAPITHPPHIAEATSGDNTAAAGGDFCSDAADVESDAFPVHGEGPFRLEVAWVKAVRDGD